MELQLAVEILSFPPLGPYSNLSQVSHYWNLLQSHQHFYVKIIGWVHWYVWWILYWTKIWFCCFLVSTIIFTPFTGGEWGLHCFYRVVVKHKALLLHEKGTGSACGNSAWKFCINEYILGTPLTGEWLIVNWIKSQFLAWIPLCIAISVKKPARSSLLCFCSGFVAFKCNLPTVRYHRCCFDFHCHTEEFLCLNFAYWVLLILSDTLTT